MLQQITRSIAFGHNQRVEKGGSFGSGLSTSTLWEDHPCVPGESNANTSGGCRDAGNPDYQHLTSLEQLWQFHPSLLISSLQSGSLRSPPLMLISAIQLAIGSLPPALQGVFLSTSWSSKSCMQYVAPLVDAILLQTLRHSNYEDSTCVRGHRPSFPALVMHVVQQLIPLDRVTQLARSVVENSTHGEIGRYTDILLLVLTSWCGSAQFPSVLSSLLDLGDEFVRCNSLKLSGAAREMMHWLRESFSEELMQALVLRHATGGVWTTESPFDKDFQTAGKLDAEIHEWTTQLAHMEEVHNLPFIKLRQLAHSTPWVAPRVVSLCCALLQVCSTEMSGKEFHSSGNDRIYLQVILIVDAFRAELVHSEHVEALQLVFSKFSQLSMVARENEKEFQGVLSKWLDFVGYVVLRKPGLVRDHINHLKHLLTVYPDTRQVSMIIETCAQEWGVAHRVLLQNHQFQDTIAFSWVSSLQTLRDKGLVEQDVLLEELQRLDRDISRRYFSLEPLISLLSSLLAHPAAAIRSMAYKLVTRALNVQPRLFEQVFPEYLLCFTSKRTSIRQDALSQASVLFPFAAVHSTSLLSCLFRQGISGLDAARSILHSLSSGSLQHHTITGDRTSTSPAQAMDLD